MSIEVRFPRRARGRQSAEAQALYAQDLAAFCEALVQIRSTLDFDISSRGWCYILEEYGLGKGDFDAAQTLIGDCRKDGSLPLDIVAEDNARQFNNLESIDATTPEEQAHFVNQLHDVSAQQRVKILEDLYWSLFNSPEFSWNH